MSEINKPDNDGAEDRGQVQDHAQRQTDNQTQAADSEPRIDPNIVDDAAWDIPSLEFPSVSQPLVPDMPSIPSLNTHTRRAVGDDSASDPLGLSDVADIPTEPETPTSPKADNADTVVIQPITIPEEQLVGTTPTQDAVSGTVVMPGVQTHGAIPPFTTAGTASGTPADRHPNPNTGGHRSHTKVIIIAIVTVLVVVALVAGGVYLWKRHQAQQAQSQALSLCTQARSEYDDAAKSLDTALAKATEAQKDTSGIDSAVVDQLSSAVTNASKIDSAAACDTSLQEEALTANAKTNSGLADDLTKAVKSVNDAVSAVDDARKAKLEELKQQLQTLVSSARQLLSESDGAVADTTVRDTLQQAADAADAQLQADASTLTITALQQSIDAINTATTAVNDSMNAYKEQQRAYYLQQQQQQQQALQNQSNTDNGTGSSGTGTGNRTDGTGGTGTTGTTGTTTDGTGSGSGTTGTGSGSTTTPTTPNSPSTGGTGTAQ